MASKHNVPLPTAPSALVAVLAVVCCLAGPVAAQAGAAPETCASVRPDRPLRVYKSVERLADGRVLFRFCAPEANAVTADLRGDVGRASQTIPMKRDDYGYWTGTSARPVIPGVHRYSFVVDGLNFTDPMNLNLEQSLTGLRSLIEVDAPETAFYSYNPKVAHGAVNIVEYWSNTLGIARRAHIYTPPGYMAKDSASYPVLYLIHGGGGTDDVWTSTGRAQYVLDNLIAAGEAVPMIVVMPEAHTPITDDLNIRYNTRFRDDLLHDLIPFVDSHYRTIARPESRAMAGLSMGSGHTLNFGLPRPDVFHYIGAFSMGLGSSNSPPHPDEAAIARYEADAADGLRRAARDMRLVYFAFGTDDPWYYTVAPTQALFDKYGIHYVFVQLKGAHEWALWRQDLADFAKRLFK